MREERKRCGPVSSARHARQPNNATQSLLTSKCASQRATNGWSARQRITKKARSTVVAALRHGHETSGQSRLNAAALVAASPKTISRKQNGPPVPRSQRVSHRMPGAIKLLCSTLQQQTALWRSRSRGVELLQRSTQERVVFLRHSREALAACRFGLGAHWVTN